MSNTTPALTQIEQNTIDHFFKLCVEHLIHARTKHPFFASRPCDDSYYCYEKRFFSFNAEAHKKRIEIDPSVENVFLSEGYEWLYETLKEPQSERAFEEAADAVAVILRSLLGDISDRIPFSHREMAGKILEEEITKHADAEK